jgi:hypothetical protein
MFETFEDYWENFLHRNPGYIPGNIHLLRKQCYEAGVVQGRIQRQPEIDELMFEFCPERMTQIQIDEWAKTQAVATNETLIWK